jgi:hypothetical protein
MTHKGRANQTVTGYRHHSCSKTKKVKILFFLPGARIITLEPHLSLTSFKKLGFSLSCFEKSYFRLSRAIATVADDVDDGRSLSQRYQKFS